MKVLFLGGPLDTEIMEIPDDELTETKHWVGEGEFVDGFPGGYRADVRTYYIHFVLIQDEPLQIPVFSCYPDSDRFNEQLARYEFEQQYPVTEGGAALPNDLPAPADRTVTIEIRGVP